TVVGLLVALSVASERIVEIIKQLIPFLDLRNTDSKMEAWRRAAIQTLAGAAGVGTAYLAMPVIQSALPTAWSELPVLLILGLLASGGSGFWNSVQTYVYSVKEITRLAATAAKSGP